MKTLIATVLLITGFAAYGIEVIQPGVETADIEIHSPDDDVKTLGKVDIIIDLAAEHDSLFELKIRRANLKLADGRASSAFGYNQEGGVIVVAADPVTHISVTGVDKKKVFAIFYNAKNEIIAPRKKDVRIFDLDLKPMKFKYEPAQPPGAMTMNVTILLDRSSSMGGFMPSVLTATRSFMTSLPDFTSCSVLTFGTNVEVLNTSRIACPSSLYVLNSGITADGATALFAALENALGLPVTKTPGVPHLVIVITDGVNTQSHAFTREQLIALKKSSDARILVFWAGLHDPEHLKGIADFESASALNIRADLDAFFNSIGVSVSGLQTLDII